METQLNDNIKSKVVSYKSALFSGFLIIVAVLVVVFGALPLYNKSKDNDLAISSKQQELDVLVKKIAELENSRRLLGSIQENSSLLDQVVPTDDDIPVVMTMIQILANESAVKINSFNYSGLTYSPVVSAPTTTSAETGQNDAFTMNINVTGRFDSVLKFLQSLENSRRLIDVSSFGYTLNTNQAQDSNFVDAITLQVLLTSYYKSFDNPPTDLNIEKYLPVIEKLKSLEYTEVDLNDVNVGKLNPFVETDTNSNAVDGAGNDVNLNPVEPADDAEFFNGDTGNQNNETTTVGSGTTNTETTTQDVEAPEGDVNDILLQLLQQEGASAQ